MFDIPVSGTMAHSWVMFHDNEYEAFKHFAITYPDNSIFLVDTYDVIGSGVPNAIKVAKEVLEPMGKRLKGIRLDSGDLAYLSAETRKMLDDANLNDCIIIASNSLDEYTIRSILEQGGKIDTFGSLLFEIILLNSSRSSTFSVTTSISEKPTIAFSGVRIP